MRIRPLGDRIIVRRSKEEEKSPGGIIIPDNAKEKPAEGVVIAVGPGKILENGDRRMMTINQGDRILFAKYQATEVRIEGEELLVVTEEDVLGVLEG